MNTLIHAHIQCYYLPIVTPTTYPYHGFSRFAIIRYSWCCICIHIHTGAT